MRGARCIGRRECRFKKRGPGLMVGPIESTRLKMPQVERRGADASQDACTPSRGGPRKPPQGVNMRKAPSGAPLPHVS